MDERIADGQKLRLGGVELTAYVHGGHTRGSLSYGLTVHEGGKGLNDTSTVTNNSSDSGSDTFTITVSGSGNTTTVTLDASGQDQPTFSDQGTENFDESGSVPASSQGQAGATGSNNAAALGNQWSDSITGGTVNSALSGATFTVSTSGSGSGAPPVFTCSSELVSYLPSASLFKSITICDGAIIDCVT